MPEILAQFDDLVWLILILAFLIVGPYLIVYVPWRVLRDLRRIADALEAGSVQRAYQAPAAPLPAPAREQPAAPKPAPAPVQHRELAPDEAERVRMQARNLALGR